MSDTESKQSKTNQESTSKPSPEGDLYYMNAEKAHDTYANLICREDNFLKKPLPYFNHELKDFSLLKPSKKSQTTYELEQEKQTFGKKNFGVQEDLVKKNLDGSIGDDLQKNKYKYGRKRFDNLGVMNDYYKNAKQENTFNCEKSKIQSNARIRKLNDQYKVNPIDILDKEKTREMNNDNRKKMALRTKAFNGYMGSKRTEHLLKNYQTMPVFVDKITNNPESILKKSIKENRKTQPIYSRYKFKHYLVGNTDEKKKGQRCQYVA